MSIIDKGNTPTQVKIIKPRQNGFYLVRTVREKVYRIVHRSELKR